MGRSPAAIPLVSAASKAGHAPQVHSILEAGGAGNRLGGRVGPSAALGVGRGGTRTRLGNHSPWNRCASEAKQNLLSLMSTDTANKPLRLPRSTWFIVSTEGCERFSFYGMTSILTLYLQHQLAMGESGAKERVHLFNAAVYYLPLLGGFLADKYVGRYPTILGLSLF